MKKIYGFSATISIKAKAVFNLTILFLLAGSLSAFSQNPNPISIENAKTDNLATDWDIVGAGDLSIQGFATEISINTGGTVHFKIDVKNPATNYSIKIYRLGYYGGAGARLIADLGSSFSGVAQDAPSPDPVTGKTDCYNWSESASWTATVSVSGIYIAKLTRNDNSVSSHIVFIVRDDASSSEVLFKTSDATWQAYNVYGGNSLYVAGTNVPGFNHAVKVSYNRPFITRDGGGGGGASEDWLFNAEYPMLRWLERNGYNVSYTTDVDMDKDPKGITPTGGTTYAHKVLLSVGHDEYWSAAERTKFENARDAGVHLAFFSGNEVYWKTRWEDNNRTLVCYKEGTLGENNCGGGCDPTNIWTGLWRDGDPAVYPGSDGGRPENALTGQISWEDITGSIQVPSAYKYHRFWRNTAVAGLADGATLTLPYGTLGYEWDWEQYQDYYPSGRITLSSTTLGGRTHKLSMYRHPGGALVFGAGTVQWSWGLDNIHDRGSEAPSQDMQQATMNLLFDMGVQPGSPQTLPSLVAPKASSDATDPVSVITSPADGSSFPANTPVTISGTASDAVGGIVAGVEVTVDGGLTWKPATVTNTPTTTNWTYNWTPVRPLVAPFTVTVRTRAFDNSWNIEDHVPTDNEKTYAVTEAVTPTCPCTIWSPADTPGIIDENDARPVELGVKFRSGEDGYITGIRFYKSTQNTGVHIGNLWSSAGVNLAQATFDNESASGWQEVSFSSPVAIAAGTNYVASYHTLAGYYSADVNYFSATGHASYYLQALQNGVDGPNGVYKYSQPPAFPTDTYQSTNYWVDVVFALNAGPDNTPPAVTSVSPSSNASGVVRTVHPTAVFNEALNPATVSSSSVLMTGPGTTPVTGTVTCTGGTVTFIPSSPLEYSTLYTVTLEGAYSANPISDIAGNHLSNSYVWSFTTSAPPPPPPVDGPGGPILVISAASNPFSRYPVEILRAEGFNAFKALDILDVTPEILTAYDVVVLGEIPLTGTFVDQITAWVTAGGTLIALRPDVQLSALLGISPDVGTPLSDRYLLVNTASGPGVGIVNQTIQYHSAADLYTLSGATSLATLYSDASTPTPANNPAITQRLVGSSGGRAVAFTYDLARSVVYTRQGNPAWAGTKRDGQIEPRRSDDMFYPDWIDLNKVAIPQADEQQRLLGNIIIQGAMHRKPMPRFWFLPKGLKAAIVMTGDDHGIGISGMKPRFDQDIRMSPAGCSVKDWECVRSTGYLYVGNSFTNAEAIDYTNLGFETAIHINTGCSNYNATEYQSFIATDMGNFTTSYPGIPLPSTNRNHCIAWPDWSTTPEVEYANGIRLDANYYYWPNSWHQNKPGMFTGSGNPMRFAKTDGTLIDVYQVVTQMQDETQNLPTTPFPEFCNALLDKAIGREGYYGVFCANMHFDNPNHPGANAITASAQAHSIPVVSSKQMLDWLDGRNGSTFTNIVWSANTLSFTIAVGVGANNLRGMLPEHSGSGKLLTLTKGGSAVPFTTETIKGISYAFFPATAGDFAATYGDDTTPPVISLVTAVPHADGTVAVTWTTDEPSSSRVDFGLTSGALASNVASATMVTSHSMTLTGLTPTSTYYFTVTSVDGATNSATSPEGSFPTPAGICANDQTLVDFSLGTTGANTLVVLDGDGAVILKPGYNEDFSGSSIPSGWSYGIFGSGTAPVFSDGQVTVDGSHISYFTSFVDGTALEFSATFTAGNFQNIGISADAAFNDTPWIVIGRGENQAATDLYARVNGQTDFLLGSNLLNSRHTFKIKRNSGVFEFYVDGAGTPAATQPVPGNTGSNMYIQISDLGAGEAVLSVDWIRVTPYAASGSYTSRVFGDGSPKAWGTVTWSADVLPSVTSLSVEARGGDTPNPASWTSGFAQISASGSQANITSSYIQYRANLSNTNTLFTPVLRDISISCSPAGNSAPFVLSHPIDAVGCSGSTVSFTTTASGYPIPAVQWLVSTNEGTIWAPLVGATNSTLSFTASGAEDGNWYKAVLTNITGTAESNPAKLTVNPALMASIAAVKPDLCPGGSIQLQLSSATGTAPYDIIVNGSPYRANYVGYVFETIHTEHSIWGTGDTPANPNGNDAGQAIEVGVKFRSSVAGYILGIRFYNGENNSGTYTGNLWSTGGANLANAVFTNVTKNGWQEVRFSSPVSIAANTTYIASYHSSLGYFAITNPGLVIEKVNYPLKALASGIEGPNGVYKYGSSGFPDGGGNANYFADVIFSEVGNNSVNYIYDLTSVTDANGCIITAVPGEFISRATVTANPTPRGTITPVPATVYEGEDYNLRFDATAGTGPFELVINGAPYSGITSGTSFSAGIASCPPKTIWPENQTVGMQGEGGDRAGIEFGLRFHSSVAVTIIGIRFYKTGTEVGLSFTATLWDVGTGTALVTAPYTGDANPGWKQVNFATPVQILANTTYLASYYSPFGNLYAYTASTLFPASPPLTPEGYYYTYTSVGGYPVNPSGANYWVDVVFDDGAPGVSNFNLTSITSSGCTLVGNPAISSTAITVNRARVWTGGTLTNEGWSVGGNWSTGVVPDGENVVIPVVTNNIYPVISDSRNVNDLIIKPSASLTIDAAGALTVSGNLTNLGTVTIKSGLTGSDLTPSGSLIVRGTSTGIVTYERKFREWTDWGTNNNFDWHYFSSPVGSNSNANTDKVSAVYSYDEVTDTWPLASMTLLTPGIGYNLDQAAHGSSDELLTFTGNVVRSAFTRLATSPYRDLFNGTNYAGRAFADGRNIDANYGGGGWNLLGNPFTSAMNVAAFIDSNNGDNAVTTDGFFDPNYEAVYVYDGSVGEHGTYVIYTTGAIQAGQGFFVLAMNNGVSFSFTPADAIGLNMQVHNTSTALLKSAKADDPWPGLELKVKYGSSESSTSILYNDTMTPGLDPGHDIGQLSAGPAVEIYTALAAKDNGVNFARQALPIAGADTIVVALGIDSENGGEVTFSAKTVPLGNNKFWLEDRATGILTNLNTNTYTVTLPAKTYGTGRFYLKSASSATGVETPVTNSGLRIWTSNDMVIIKGEVSDKAICEIYDTGGRKVVLTRLNDSELNTVSIPSGSKGVYLVRVVDGLKVTTRKVAVL